jgi:hypothetical protein
MAETLDLAMLKRLPPWKSLEEAKQLKLHLIDQAIQARTASLKALANEVPVNAASGMVFGAGNESLDLEQQFTRMKEEIKVLQEDFARTIRIDTRVVRDPDLACYGALVVARNLEVPGRWERRVFRLVLLNEQQEEQDGTIEHVELGSPLGMALLGIAQGQEFRIGLGPCRVMAEVEDIL